MSSYKEQLVTIHHVTEYGNDPCYFENKWFEFRIGDTVIGEGETMEEAFLMCGTARSIEADYEEVV